MPGEPAIRPLSDDELLYRRLPANPQFYDPVAGIIKQVAFRPTPADTDGLSLSRQVVGPRATAAAGSAGKAFYVASLRVSDIRSLGLTLVADRDDHAIITDLTNERRQSTDRAVRDPLLKASDDLASAVVDIEGPFPGQAKPSTPRRDPATAPPSRA